MNRSTLAVVLLSSLVSSTAVFAATSATSVASSDKATLKNEATATSTASTTTQATKPKHATKHHKKCAKSKSAKHATKEKSATAVITASSSTLAPQVAATPEFQQFCMRPQVTFWGLTGDATLGQTQMMLAGGDTKHAFYGFLEGTAIKDESAFKAGLGLGYRRASDAYFNTNNIYGIYVAADYDRTPGSHHYWVANPGLEALGENWDFRINGYFVLGDTDWKEGEGWMSDIGHNEFINKYDHKYDDRRFTLYDETGNGGDIEVGHTFHNLHNLKLYAGGYYYHLEHDSDVKGGELRMELPVNHLFSVEAHETYDNYKHNTFLAGIKINLGGFNKQERETFGLSSRLMDPVVHNLDTYGREFPGTPGIQSMEIASQNEHKYKNAWYFCPCETPATAGSNALSPTGGTGEANDPYKNLNPGELQAVAASTATDGVATILLEGGAGAPEFPLDHFPTGMVIPANTNLVGLGADFLPTTNEDEMPEIEVVNGGASQNGTSDAIIITGNTELHKIRIKNDSLNPVQRGISILGTSSAIPKVILEDVKVLPGFDTGIYSTYANIEFQRSPTGSAGSNNIQGFTYGIDASNSTINFTSGNNIINASGSSSAIGLRAIISTINFNDGTNNIQGNGFRGIQAITSTINFNGGHNIVFGRSGTFGTGRGIDITNLSTINFIGGQNEITGITDFVAISQGIIASTSTINFDGGKNTISGQAFAPGSTGVGIACSNRSTVNFNAGENTIMGKNIDNPGSFSIGISVRDAVLNFNGGLSHIETEMLALDPLAAPNGGGSIGITAATSTTQLVKTIVNFNNSMPVIISATGGSVQRGIDIDANATLNYGTPPGTPFDQTTISNILQYVTFSNIPVGQRVIWGNIIF